MHERVQSSPGTTTPDIRPQHGRPVDPFNSPPISLVGDLKGMRNYRRRFPTQIVATNQAEVEHLWYVYDGSATSIGATAIYNRDSDNTATVASSEQAIDLIEKSLKKAGFKKTLK